MDTSHSTTLQPSADPNTGLVEDLDRTGPLSVTTRKDNDTRSLLICIPASALALLGPDAGLGLGDGTAHSGLGDGTAHSVLRGSAQLGT